MKFAVLRHFNIQLPLYGERNAFDRVTSDSARHHIQSLFQQVDRVSPGSTYPKREDLSMYPTRPRR